MSALADYNRIAVWGAGSLAVQAMNRWLPRNRIETVVDSDPGKQGSEFFGLSIEAPEQTDFSGYDAVVVCITAYAEAFVSIREAAPETPCFYIFELLTSDCDGPSEIAKLKIDYVRSQNGSLIATLVTRPQFFAILTYRLTRHCQTRSYLRPAFFVCLFWHYCVCAWLSIELPCTVEAGAGLKIAHLGGVVFNRDVRLGNCVTLYQFTTLGADDSGAAPEIGSFVTVNTGAAVLGACRIGEHSRIGANATVLGLACPPGSTVVGTPARIVKTYDIFQRPI